MSKRRRRKEAEEESYLINVAESMRAIGSGTVTGPQARVLAAIILGVWRDRVAQGEEIPADVAGRHGLQVGDFAQVANWTVDDLIDGCRELYAVGLLSAPASSIN